MTIDTTPTDPPRNWFLELTKAPTEDLLAEATRLREKLAYAQEKGHRVDARAYELRLLDVERAVAVHNRRATEVEDQRQAVQPTLTADEVRAVVHGALMGILGGMDIAPSDTHHLGPLGPDGRNGLFVSIAARVVEKLAGRVGALSETEREVLDAARSWRATPGVDAAVAEGGSTAPWVRALMRLERAVDRLLAGAPAVAVTGAISIMDAPPALKARALDQMEQESRRLTAESRAALWCCPTAASGDVCMHGRNPDPLHAVDPAQREADLREAFLAGTVWAAGPTIVEAARHHRDGAAAEYARSKAVR